MENKSDKEMSFAVSALLAEEKKKDCECKYGQLRP